MSFNKYIKGYLTIYDKESRLKMEPLNNNGMVNYPIAMPEQETMQNNYAAMPAEYDAEFAEKKKASSKMLGMTALGITAAVCAGLAAKKGKGLKEAKNALADMTAERDKLAQELDTANQKIEKLTPKSFSQKIKNAFKKLKFWGKNDTKKAAEEAKKEVEDAVTKKD